MVGTSSFGRYKKSRTIEDIIDLRSTENDLECLLEKIIMHFFEKPSVYEKDNNEDYCLFT